MKDINEILSDDGVRETEILSDENLDEAGEIEVNTIAKSAEKSLTKNLIIQHILIKKIRVWLKVK